MFEWCQRKILGILFVAVAIVLSGAASYIALPKESTPDITIPVVNIVVTQKGVDALDMEKNVTKKIESKLRSISGVKKITSTSSEGLASISVEFETAIEIDSALAKVKDKVDQVQSELPADADAPIISEINLSEFHIMFLNLAGDDQATLERLADRLEDELKAIPGVLEVDIYGKRELDILISIDIHKITAAGINPHVVGNQILRESITVGNGKLYVDDQVLHIKTDGEFRSPEPILNLKIPTPDGHFVYLRDLGRVEFVEAEYSTLSLLNGEPSVSIGIKKQAGKNLLAISQQVYAIAEYFNAHKPDGVREIVINTDQSVETRSMLADLENGVLTALLSVVLVSFFMLGWRNTILVALVIPFSMLMSFLVLDSMDITLNMIVLFSLILALGMLVDNAIVVVENIYRLSSMMPVKQAVVAGVREVAFPIATSTLTTLCAFIPLLFWDGVIGDFMMYLPLTLIITLSASLATALFISPLIARLSMKSHRRVFHRPYVLGVYERILEWTLRHSKVTIFGSFAFLVIIVMAYGKWNAGMEFFPKVEPKNAVVKVAMAKNADRDATERLLLDVDRVIASFADVESRTATISQAEGRVNIEFLDIALRTQSSFQTIDDIRKAIPAYPGAKIEIMGRDNSPTSAYALTIDVSGETYPELEQALRQVKRVMENDTRITEIIDNYNKENFYLRVLPRRDALSFHEMTSTDVSNALSLFFKRTKVMTLYDAANEEYDLVAKVDDAQATLAQALVYPVMSPRGIAVPLSELVDIEYDTMLFQVNRKDNKRTITINAQVAEGVNSIAVQRDLDASVKALRLPDGVRVVFTGQAEDQQETQAFLVWAFFTAVFLIFAILVFQFHSFVVPLIISTTVLFSIIGVLIGLLVLQMPFGIVMTGIGVVSLAGIVVNNAIVLFDYIQRRYDKTGDMRRSIVNAGKIRLRPVFLTAITTIVGLLPMCIKMSIDFREFAIVFGTESSQWWQSMAIALVSGLLFATFLTLILVPTMYYDYYCLKQRVMAWWQAKKER
ncbi:efflux RND transporter permease subunit [Chrysiogenes arsenatis]|uniref:efflux RND transporter permease subunit n=1 Tax=Chrysiogenes arsenatis TaxID=309797 RepID=UPI00041CD86D|nr:efflux RND transporter permease subunit [Chrysiogenes arsenatis]